MKKSNEKIEGTAEAWESGALGMDDEFVKISTLTIDDIEDDLGLHAISIRLKKSLIEELKLIAQIHGLGYQPLMKQILQRFVDAEKKNILRQHAEEFAQEDVADNAPEKDTEAA